MQQRRAMGIRQVARAKVNLCLHVIGQRADGYHLLDSIVAFAEFGDLLTFAPAKEVTLTIDGPFANDLSDKDDNFILRAAKSFASTQGAAIHLQKNLPIASGVGGGSADAAATFRGLAELWKMPLPDTVAQLALGADVPVCMAQACVRMRGIGEVISPLVGWVDVPAILVNPGVQVSTPLVFRTLAQKANQDLGNVPDTDVMGWLSAQRNDLQDAAIAIAPVIDDVVSALWQSGAILARMSGSGASCFGVYETDIAASRAAEDLARAQPTWWVQTTRLTT
jgi:4-diphosphocytidyl-2-C-methyl-D-erythritol kinase